jgi:hypothetical protein
VDVVRHPYSGFFDWTGLLKLKENISRELGKVCKSQPRDGLI